MTILWLWLYNQYIYYKHFFPFLSQNKAENICDPGPQNQS